MSLAKDVIGKPFGALPILRFIPPFRKRFYELSKAFEEFNKFLEEEIQEHEETLDPENPRDYIDMFLIQKEKDELGIFTKSQLIVNCTDMFVAGSETTSKSLSYAIAVLMRHPDVQEKAFNNIEEVDEEILRVKDKSSLPYVEATLNEVWRYCNIAAFGPPRYAHQDTAVGDQVIPAGAAVLYNTFTLHMDKHHWGDPEIFRLERSIGKV